MLPANTYHSGAPRPNGETSGQPRSRHDSIHNDERVYTNSLSDESLSFSRQDTLMHKDHDERHGSATVREEDAMSLLEMMQRKNSSDAHFFARQEYLATLWGESMAYEPSAEDKARLLERIYYTWIEDRVHLAAKEQLSFDVLPYPTKDSRTHTCGQQLARAVQAAVHTRYAWSNLSGAQMRSTTDETSLGVLRWVGIPQQGGFTHVMAAVEWVRPPAHALAAHRANPANSPFFNGTLHGEWMFTPGEAACAHRYEADIPCLATLENPQALEWVTAPRGSAAAAALGIPTRISLFRCLFTTLPHYIVWQFPFKIMGDVCTLSIPMLLSMYVHYLSKSYSSGVLYGFMVVLLLFLTQAVQSASLHRFYYISIKCGLQYRSALSILLFEKCFLISRRALAHPEINAGRVINMVSNDVERVRMFMEFCMYIWSSPLTFIVSLILLAKIVGWCVISAVVAMCVWAPLNSYMLRRLLALRRQLSKATDARVKATNEFLSGIRIAKMMAWEPHFIASIESRRAVEVDYVRQAQHFRVMISFINSATPIVMIATVFMLYSWSGHALKATVVFPVIALLSIIRMPFMMIPFALTSFINLSVALGRIRRFIECDDRVFASASGVESFLQGVTSGHTRNGGDVAQSGGPATMPDAKHAGQTTVTRRDAASASASASAAAVFDHADILAAIPQQLPTMPRVRVPIVIKALRRILGRGWRPARSVLMHGDPVVDVTTVSSSSPTGESAQPAHSRNGHAEREEDDEDTDKDEDEESSDEVYVTCAEKEEDDVNYNGKGVAGAASATPSRRTQRHATTRRPSAHELAVMWVKEQSTSSSNTKARTSSSLPAVTAPAAATTAAKPAKGDDAAGFHVLTERVLLHDTTFRIPAGKLTMIVGATGSGKTVLLQSMLGQFEIQKGTVWATSNMAYVPQESWIMNATLRENIVFFDTLDESALKRAVQVSQLEADLQTISGGLDAEIGEKGINLSGGQKARVNLARAVYADREMVILDDPLSALDAHVGRRVMMDCILGALAGKTRVLATHHLHVVPYADYVVAVGEKRVLFAGPREEFMQSLAYRSLMTMTHHESGADSHSHSRSGRTHHHHHRRRRHSRDANAGTAAAGERDDGDEEMQEGGRQQHVDPSRIDASSWMSEAEEEEQESSDADSSSSSSSREGKELDRGAESRGGGGSSTTTAVAGNLIVQEEKAVGSVPWSTYLIYFNHCGGTRRVAVVLGIFVFTEVLSVSSTVVLSVCSNNSYYCSSEYMTVYGGLILLAILGIPLRFYFAFNTMRRGGVRLHRALLTSVASGTMQFFDTTPLGRIINRFSRDIDVVDDSLQMTLIAFLNCTMIICSSMLVTSLSQPMILLILLPAGWVYYRVMIFYNSANREVRRFSSLVKSPVFSLLGEVTNGMATIQAFGRSTTLMREACRRIDIAYATGHLENVSNRWLGVRVEMISIVVVTAIALSGVVSIYFDVSWFDPGLVSLAVTMSLQCTSNLNWFVRNTAATEADMNSVERLVYYSMNIDHEAMPEVEEEARSFMSAANPPRRRTSWSGANDMSHALGGHGEHAIGSGGGGNSAYDNEDDDARSGELQLREVELRYRPELPLVLRGVSFVIQPRQKVGIVGRTGSGKSTMLLTFMRMVDICGGEIVVNGMPIMSYSLRQLRKLFSVIPQDPVLFDGTVRTNLDPFSQSSDEEVWEALSVVGMRDRIAAEAEGIDSRAEEGGSNFSVGQRQLLCMARALLRRGSNFILMDEATANVDHKLDQKIQLTVMRAFRRYTVIAIAHRLETIAPYDRVIVMDGGRVAEMGSPRELVTRPGSMLSAMVAASGEEQSKRFFALMQKQ